MGAKLLILFFVVFGLYDTATSPEPSASPTPTYENLRSQDSATECDAIGQLSYERVDLGAFDVGKVCTSGPDALDFGLAYCVIADDAYILGLDIPAPEGTIWVGCQIAVANRGEFDQTVTLDTFPLVDNTGEEHAAVSNPFVSKAFTKETIKPWDVDLITFAYNIPADTKLPLRMEIRRDGTVVGVFLLDGIKPLREAFD